MGYNDLSPQVPRVLRIGDYVGDDDEDIYELVARGIVGSDNRVIFGEPALEQGNMEGETVGLDTVHAAALEDS